MEERNTIKLKKEEFAIKNAIKANLGKGKMSKVVIEYTPMGEKIIISTHKPGLVIGRKGEKINELTQILKKKYKMDNPHIEIEEILIPEFDAQIMADEIALGLERFGPMKFKVLSYRALQRILKAGAQGVEIRLNGKLPGSRAKSWRFAQGILKKTGDAARVVDRAQARSETKPGTVGVKVSILSPEKKLIDRVIIDEKMIEAMKANIASMGEKPTAKESKVKKVKTPSQVGSKKGVSQEGTIPSEGKK